MAENATKVPVKQEKIEKPSSTLQTWQPFEGLRDEIDRYEITAELPGMDEKNIEVKVAAGVLTIKGEKREETEKREQDYYLQERSFGSFERSFEVPETVARTRSKQASGRAYLC